MSDTDTGRLPAWVTEFRLYGALLAMAGVLLVVSGLLGPAGLSVASLTVADLVRVVVGNLVFLVGVAAVFYPDRFGPDEVPIWILLPLLVAILGFLASVLVRVV